MYCTYKIEQNTKDVTKQNLDTQSPFISLPSTGFALDNLLSSQYPSLKFSQASHLHQKSHTHTHIHPQSPHTAQSSAYSSNEPLSNLRIWMIGSCEVMRRVIFISGFGSLDLAPAVIPVQSSPVRLVTNIRHFPKPSVLRLEEN